MKPQQLSFIAAKRLAEDVSAELVNLLMSSGLGHSAAVLELAAAFRCTDIPAGHQIAASELDNIAESADAFIDIIYYLLNFTAKVGWNNKLTTTFVNNKYVKRWATDVHQFTAESFFDGDYNKTIPVKRPAVFFICRMIISELLELLCVFRNVNEAKKEYFNIIAALGRNINIVNKKIAGGRIAANIILHILHSSAFLGWDLDVYFVEVHSANMRKKIGGIFKKRIDGKIEKPANWTAPDIKKIAAREIEINTLHADDY